MDWKRKLSSRKLWVAIAGFVTSVLIFTGTDEGSAAQVASIIMSGATVISYILAEGFVDSARGDEDNGDDTTD